MDCVAGVYSFNITEIAFFYFKFPQSAASGMKIRRENCARVVVRKKEKEMKTRGSLLGRLDVALLLLCATSVDEIEIAEAENVGFACRATISSR